MYASSEDGISRKRACEQYFLESILMLLNLVPLSHQFNILKKKNNRHQREEKKKKGHVTSIILPSQDLAYMEIVPIYFHH